ncbi:MAG: peptidylprolyl isomerase [Gemmatimonadaceae bacterium]
MRTRAIVTFNPSTHMHTSSRSAAVALLILAAACEKAPAPAAKAPIASTPAAAAAPSEALLHPDYAKFTAQGPDSFAVHVVTSHGAFDLKVHRNWSPKGADRLYYLFSNNYFDGIRFFRVINGFMAQFGMSGDTAVQRVWKDLNLRDEPVTHSNKRGTLTFADAGPDTRSTQLFINFADNAQLDRGGFTPVGEVTNGMGAVDSLYGGYGEGAPAGKGPDQTRITLEGNTYLEREFPKLDYIVTAHVSQEWKKGK